MINKTKLENDTYHKKVLPLLTKVQPPVLGDSLWAKIESSITNPKIEQSIFDKIISSIKFSFLEHMKMLSRSNMRVAVSFASVALLFVVSIFGYNEYVMYNDVNDYLSDIHPVKKTNSMDSWLDQQVQILEKI